LQAATAHDTDDKRSDQGDKASLRDDFDRRMAPVRPGIDGFDDVDGLRDWSSARL
jgi:hypothetical protein